MDKIISKTIVCATCGHPNNVSCQEGQSTYQCECCERIHSIPKDEEKYSTLYDRATDLRLNNCFDQAIATYNMILDQDDANEEAHFWIAMCRYGVNYVKDDEGIYRPTCWDYHEKPILADYDYQRALNLANPVNAEIYRSKAEEVNRIQRKIGKIIQTEKAYDAFICYKETNDATGRRTSDSSKAGELYDALTEKGYRVFFAPRTFQSVLVEEYEPYIYAALYSAKAMYIITSSREYVESKWVKNEWLRFIEFKKKDPDKILRVLLLRMSSNNLPAELANYQAYDISRLGIFERMCDELAAITQRKTEVEPGELQTGSLKKSFVEPSEAMLERGNNFLSTGEFEHACEYFNKALNTNAKLSNAYWGLLLAEHQCRTNDELIVLGVCIDNESNYKFACQYADDDAKKEYQNVAQMVQCMGQVYIVDMVCNKDLYRASLRTENYASSGLCDNNIIEVHENFDRRENFSEINAVAAKALEALLENFTTDACFAELNKKFHLSDAIEEEYSACLDRIFEQILVYGERGENAPEQNLNLLTSIEELAAAWTKNAGERYLTLAEKLKTQDIYTNDTSVSEWTKFVFDCYDKAVSLGADQNKCLAAKRDFFELALKKADSISRLDFLSEEYPDEWQVYWKYIQILMKDNDPKEMLSPNRTPCVDKVINTSVGTYLREPQNSSKEIEDAINHQEERIRYCEKLPEEMRKKAESYLEKLFACAGDKKVELQKEWDVYIQGVDSCCDKTALLFRKDLEKIKKIENKLRRLARGKGIAGSILSLMLLIFPGCALFYALQNLRAPERLLPYSGFWYTTAAVSICLVGGVISVMIQRYLRKFASDERNDKEITKKLPLAAAILTAAVTVGSIAIFILAAKNFDAAIGTIEIGTPEEIVYIKKHPNANFVISKDIDLTEEEWKTIGTLGGTLDGQGHCLNGAYSTGSCLFDSNKGTIKNITFVNTSTDAEEFYLVRTNYGTISGCKIDGFLSGAADSDGEEKVSGLLPAVFVLDSDAKETFRFYGFASSNQGSILDCTLTDITGDFSDFAGIARINGQEGTVKNCTISELSLNIQKGSCGVAWHNEGTIADVDVLNYTLTSGEQTLDYLAGICGENTDKGIVTGCRVESMTAEDIQLSLGGGLIANSAGKVSDCTVVDLYVSGKAEGIFGGLIGTCSGDVAHCSVQGNALLSEADIKSGYVSDIPWLVYGGLLGEQRDCNVTNSSSTVNLYVDSQSVSYRGIEAGGISGYVQGTCAIQNSFFDGTLQLVTAYGQKTNYEGTKSTSKYYSTNDYSVGGFAACGQGSLSVSDSYCTGRATVRITEGNSTGIIAIKIGGFFSSFSSYGSSKATVRNSYSTLRIESWIPEDRQSRLSSTYVNNWVGGFDATGSDFGLDVENSFFAGTFDYIKQEKASCIPGFKYSPNNAVNAYVRENCGYESTHYYKYFVPENSFRTSSFLIDTLGWDDKVWDIEDGSLPMLKNVKRAVINTDVESEESENG